MGITALDFLNFKCPKLSISSNCMLQMDPVMNYAAWHVISESINNQSQYRYPVSFCTIEMHILW